jgi:hypothetical protein
MTRPRLAALTGAMTLLLVACSGPGASPRSPASSASPGPTASSEATSSPLASRSAAPSGTGTPAPSAEALSPAELTYRLADALGALWFCDPDEYPVARDDEEALAAEHFDEIRRDRETFAAILDRLGLDASSVDTDHQLAIYREWKMLNAVALEPAGADAFAFDYLAQPAAGGDTGTRSTGTIDASGHIDVERQDDAPAPACPICLARGTLIATPSGSVAVELLAVGDRVWSLDTAGRRISVPTLRIGSMRAPEGHHVIRLRLADGREVTASASHPLADGRPIGIARVGDDVDGARVVSATVLAYGDGRTYDLLPAGPTGAYWAGGIRLESTLRRLAAPVTAIAVR